MSEKVEPQPVKGSPDVVIENKNGKWKVKKGNEVEKQPGNQIVIGAPGGLEDWDVWFDPMMPPHKPNSSNHVVIELPAHVPHAKKKDVAGGQKKTVYKYTIRVHWEGEDQIIDPKIIIDPPT